MYLYITLNSKIEKMGNICSDEDKLKDKTEPVEVIQTDNKEKNTSKDISVSAGKEDPPVIV